MYPRNSKTKQAIVPYQLPSEATLWVFSMFWLAGNLFWCPPRFHASRVQFSLKVHLFSVRFMCWDWTLDGYAVLHCCVIHTLYFSIFPTQKEAQQLLSKEPGESNIGEGYTEKVLGHVESTKGWQFPQ